jgi:hypothetical protein
VEDFDAGSWDSLIRLVVELPSDLQDIYAKKLRQTLNSLNDEKKVEVLRKVLTWILLARRPLKLGELMTALAIEPDTRNVPPEGKEYRRIGRFIAEHITPFVTISTSVLSGNMKPRGALMDPSATVRLVHESAREFLEESCTVESAWETWPELSIDVAKGHESLARSCLVYLGCKEFECGWIGPRAENEVGLVVVDEKTKGELQSYLQRSKFLGYSVTCFNRHLGLCQPSGNDDIFDCAIRVILSYPKNVELLWQVHQYVQWPDYTAYNPPRSPFLTVSSLDSADLLERYLATQPYDINETDASGETALSCALIPGGKGRSNSDLERSASCY